MVNRILIRVKVVQMLYSYLLTRSEFKIDEMPETTSRDKRYAYTAYLELLLLLLELSGYSVTPDGRKPMITVPTKLGLTKVAKALASNDAVRSVILRANTNISALNPVLAGLINKIDNSQIYADYSKKTKPTLEDGVTLWVTIFETIIAKDKAVEEALRTNPDFTLLGYENAVAAVVNTLRSYNDSRQLLINAQNDLEKSLTKAYELYLGLLKLIVDLTHRQQERLEAAKGKFNATSEDLNPNTKLADNYTAQYLADNADFQNLIKEYKVQLASPTSNFVDLMLDRILESEIYQKYLEHPVGDFRNDGFFWREVMRSIILPSDLLTEEMEGNSVFWNDDLNIMGTFVLKTLKQIAVSEGKPVSILPKFKDHDDEVFGRDLFMYAIDNYEAYRKYIDRFIDSTHWDPDRMAYMDIVIMVTAIAEIINYPSIPLPVSINEYVDIANNYSTEKSGSFINGVLFSVTKQLNADGKITK